MEEEIDLRPYVTALGQHWHWILGSGFVAALIALIISFLLPPTYEATALVAITRPRYVLQFDSRFQNVSNIQPVYRAYPELAMSDDLLQELRPLAGNVLAGAALTDLRQTLSASAGDDPSLVRLSASGSDPQMMTQLANAWADLYVQRANELFGNQNSEEVAFFEAQLATAGQELDRAQQALVDFQGQNRSAILQTQLLDYTEAQTAYLARQRALTLLLEDIEGLRRQLAALPDRQAVTTADQLTALLLQIKAFNAGDTAMLQLQLEEQPAEALLSVGEQRALLAGLAEAVGETAVNLAQQLAELEPQILQAQTELQQLTATYDRLRRDVTITEETYSTLSRKLEEARLTTEGVGSEVQLASYAAAPESPSGPRKGLNSLVAGFLGVVVAMFIVLVRHWWQGNEMTPARDPAREGN